MPFSLDMPGGWFDIPASIWAAGGAVTEDHLVALNSLIRFAATADEYLQGGPVKNGDTVPLAASADDGYNYSLSEVLYAWALQANTNPANGANSGGGNLFILNQFIAQDTGVVASAVDYYAQGGAETVSPDGLIAVLLCCRRGAGNRTAIATGTGGGASGGGGGTPTGGSGAGSGSGDSGQGDQGDGSGKTPRAVK